MSHLILLGDSIFDNGVYVPNEPAVIDQVNALLATGSNATLLARDGDLIENVEEQLASVPSNATHLFLSVGGNNVLGYRSVLTNGSALLNELTNIYFEFEVLYQYMILKVLQRGLPTTVCTIYSAIPGLPNYEVMALALFNDTIVRTAAAHGLPVIDLRLLCTESSDYAEMSPIEPSCSGGAKIASVIARVTTQHSFEQPSTTVYPSAQ